MKINKEYIFIAIINLFFSMTIVYFSPRFDIVSLVLFLGLNLLLLFLVRKLEMQKKKRLEEKNR